ncbi:MAG: AsmA-like C-terminal region-containing protein, partial [Ahrensia sp.]
IDTSFMEQLQTDLRISANTARFDDFELTGVAATAQTTADLALFDLGDATAFSGALQARLRFDRNPEAPTIELNVSGQDINMGAAISTLQLPAVLPNGLNNFSLTMNAALGDWSDLLQNARGKMTMRQASGAIAGFGPETLKAADGLQFTQIDTTTNGASFESFAVEAPIIDGELKLEETTINYDETTRIALNGVVQLANRSMALTARLDKSPDGQNQQRYFIGGGWDAPYIFGTLNGPPLPAAQ